MKFIVFQVEEHLCSCAEKGKCLELHSCVPDIGIHVGT